MFNRGLTTPQRLIVMKYYTSTTQFNCGIDLHARQMYVCLTDRQCAKLGSKPALDNPARASQNRTNKSL